MASLTAPGTGRRIFQIMAGHTGRPRFWRHDCATAVLDVYRAFGIIRDERLLGWRTGDALGELRRQGGDILVAAGAVARDCGFRPVPADDAHQVFDMGIGLIGEDQTLCVHNGLGFLARGLAGPILVPGADAVWRPSNGH